MKKVILIFLAIATLTSCNESKKEPQKLMKTKKLTTGTVELTTFKLNKGIASDTFVKAAQQMETDFLKHQQGFIKRTLTVSGDTLWTDIVYWENLESHGNAMKVAEKSEKVIPFMEKIDFASVKMNIAKPMLLED